MPMTTTETLDRGRAAYQRQAWGEAYAQLSAAEQEAPLEPDDLVLLAMAAFLLGRDADSDTILTRAHREYLGRGDVERAVRCAFWLGMQLMDKGEMAQASGWFARARR